MALHRPLLAALLVLGAPLAAAAEPAPASVVFRLSADGNWLGALVEPATPGDVSLYLAPLHPRVDERGGAATLSLQSVGGLSLQLSGDRTAIVAPWCSQLSAWLTATGALGGDCAPALEAGTRQGVSVAWQDAVTTLAVGAERTEQSASDGPWPRLLAPTAPLVPTAASLSSMLPVRGEHLAAAGRWWLDPRTALNVTASTGEWSLQPRGQAPLVLDQHALEIGLSYGPFSGGVTGRSVRPVRAGDGARWNALDIGVSWRTPWSGELSVGARNVLGYAEEGTEALDEVTERTPYVRYRQDF